VVENRSGVGGNIAMQAAARSTLDGYTLVVAGQGPFALNPHTWAARSAPEIPTLAESGLPGFETIGWLGIAAPAGTPVPIIALLQREITTILQTDEARKYFASQGRAPVASTPAEFAAFIRAEHAKW
jgi:tripartite-type tricarboxylate transporter receptor subunit TctC